MTIDDVLIQIRDKEQNRLCYGKERNFYGKEENFTIPLKWKSTSYANYAPVSHQHAKMIASASGDDLSDTVTIPNPDDFLGIGKNNLKLLKIRRNVYHVRHSHSDPGSPVILPKSIDLTKLMRPHEGFDVRPNEMIPEDFYL